MGAPLFAELHRDPDHRHSDLITPSAATSEFTLPPDPDVTPNAWVTTLDLVSDGVIVTDTEGLVTYLNAVATRLTGWSSDEAWGRPHEQIFRIRDACSHAPLSCPVESVLAGAAAQPARDIGSLLTRDGREIRVEDRVSPLHNAAGALIGAVLVFRDTTAHHAAREALRGSEEFNRTLLAHSPDCIKVIDLEGRIVSINPNGCRLLELEDPATCLRRPWLDFWTGDDRARAAAALAEASEGRSHRFEACCRDFKGRDRWWEVITTPIPDASGRIIGVLAVSRDVTGRIEGERSLKEAHDRLARQTDDLRRSNEDLERFAYTASHDLKSPVCEIMLTAAVMEMKCRAQLDADGIELLHMIHNAATRMRTLIDDLLDYSKVSRDTGPADPISADDALDAALANLRGAIDQSSALVTRDPLPAVRIGSTHLLQLFQNLIQNAINYRGPERPEIHISAERREADWLFRVRDNGLGIAEENHALVFEPFLRLRANESPGTGIGLASCRKIVERVGGSIWVESELGLGATFCFSLPPA